MQGERGIIMKCKYCYAELQENAEVCPVCGKLLIKEEEEVQVAQPVKKEWKLWQRIVAGVVGVAILVLLATVFLEYVLDVPVLPRDNDIYYRNSYTVKDAKAEKTADKVIATIGNQKLTNGVLQAYYWLGVFDYLDKYGYYLEYSGFDFSKPLHKQIFDAKTGMTYQQMFLQQALESWRRYASLVQMAEEDNFTLTAEQQTYLDSFYAQMEALAKENGYDDVEKFIDKELFPGSSMAAYFDYSRMSYIALSYYDTLYEQWLPTEQEIEDYYNAHEQDFKNSKIDKESGNYFDVRHILIAVEGGTKDADGKTVYSEAEWEACLAKAQKMLDEFKAGEATEEAFAELARLHSQDPGSAEAGGLYNQLTKDTSFIEGFKNWYLEEGRKPGDTGLVKNTESSVQGYHIMYFSKATPIWEYEATTQFLSEKTMVVLEDAKKQWPMEVNFKEIVLGYVPLIEE